MNLSYYLRKAKDIHLKDVLSFFPMVMAIILSPLFYKKYHNTWAVCERKDEARDNGYHFFEYMCREHPEQPCIYAIDRKSCDYERIKNMGLTVQFGSVKHWILYFTSKYLISSQSYHPNNYMATLIERIGLFQPNHVFLQHGITINHAEFLLASHRKACFFVAGAKPEYEYMRDYFGYPEGTIQYTGFARFDALHDYAVKTNRILIMPTWRKWLWQKSEKHEGLISDISNSAYFASWSAFLKNEHLSKMIEKENLDVIFYPHPNSRETLDINAMINPLIRIADIETDDIQQLMKTSALLITDYSSVFFDMVYMKKPVIFFQFDEEKYRKYHYNKGWFDYRTTPFGVWCNNVSSLLKALENAVDSGYGISDNYLREHERVFELYDAENCRRIYEILKDAQEHRNL